MLYNVVLVSAMQQPKSVSSNIYIYIYIYIGFPSGSAVKNAPSVQEMPETWVCELGRSPGGGIGILLQYSCLENLMGNEPWGRKESDTTEVPECP